MKRYIFLAFLLATITNGFAQQLQTSSLYDMQGVLHNPSTAGADQKGMIGLTYRSQWSGISGAPKTATIFGSFDLPEHKIALGGYLYNDKTGPTSRTGLQLAFAKYIPMQNESRLSFGIETRFQQYSLDREKLMQAIGSDPAISGGDNQFKFDAGFGISYTSKKLQLGASVSQLVQSKLNFYSGNLSRTEEARLYRHYYFHGRYKWNVDETVTIVPHFLMIYLPNAPVELQAGARLEYDKLFWLGGGFRLNQGAMLSAGIHINKVFTVGYSFDIYKAPASVFNNGGYSHEVILRYNILK